MDNKEVSPFARIEEEKTVVSSSDKVTIDLSVEDSDNGYAHGLPDWNILPPNFSVRRGKQRG